MRKKRKKWQQHDAAAMHGSARADRPMLFARKALYSFWGTQILVVRPPSGRSLVNRRARANAE
eukprot:391445-Pyramimonas_sp.AAC.1